jgi:hypothetical protein
MGGWVPTGNNARIALVAATTCEIARSRFTSGWKYSFCTEMPFTVSASMSLMPLTLELIAYWL